ncbi:MAG: hypothetical protein ACE366_14770 [Bradymonadia bacterium]
MKTDWETIYNRFDPEEPVPFAHHEWRVRRRYSPLEQLNPQLNRPFGDKRFVIIGTVGTGKSTELLALAESRIERDFVVVVDLWSFFDRLGDPSALDHIQPWEAIFLTGIHIYRAAMERGHTWSSERTDALQKARQAFEPAEASSIDIFKLAQAITVVVGGALGGVATPIATGLSKLAAVGKWTVQVGRRAKVQEQDEKVQTLLNAVNALLGDLNAQGKRVACFIDGLDRVRALDTVEHLFTESTLLGHLNCATVMTGPILIRREGLGGALRQFKVQVLSNVPVLDREAPLSGVTTNGSHFFRKAWSARTQDGDLSHAIPEPLLDQLAWASGGRARNFMRMIREVVQESYSAQLDVTTQDIIEAVIDQQRRDLEMGINLGHLELLKKVVLNKGQLPEDERILDLLKRFWLLPYPNESEWYYPNPLLLLVKLKDALNTVG